MVTGLEQRWLDLYGERSTDLMERRRQDTRDQTEEITSASSQLFISLNFTKVDNFTSIIFFS